MIVALLMGRKGSKGFPGKNLFPVLGKPMAFYPMNAAKQCPDIDAVYISTDDEALMKLAAENNVHVIVRPPALCADQALGEDVYIHAYREAAEMCHGSEIELVILLMCNAPLVSHQVLSEGIKILRAHPEYDSAVTVSRYNMWSPLRARKISADGLLQPFVSFETFGDPQYLTCDRDSQGDVWFADMGASIVRPRCLEHIHEGLLPQRWMGRKICPLKQTGGLDVDYEWQIPQLELLLRRQNAEKGGLS